MRLATWLPWCALLAAGPSAAQERLSLQAHETTIERYGRVEFTIDTGRSYDHPFDPDEVDLRLLVRAPSGDEITVPAFLSQPYERQRLARDGREADWCYPVGDPRWLARFTPVEIGEYEAQALLRDGRGGSASAPIRFECVPSDAPGFVRVSERDPRFLEFPDGKPFFAIGQNVAFVGDAQYLDLTGMEETLAGLGDGGANLVRLWACCDDWALAIEAPKSAWGRSWAPSNAIVACPDDAERRCLSLSGEVGAALTMDPSHAVALRPGAEYRLTGRLRVEGASVGIDLGPERYSLPAGPGDAWHDFAVRFRAADEQYWLGRPSFQLTRAGTAWLDSVELQEARGGPNLLWEADVNRPRRGEYNLLDCFILDEIVLAAERTGVRLMLCLLTRDLYMGDLVDEGSPEYAAAVRDARNLMRYAVARWGCSPSVALWEYWNEMDPGRPTDAFYREVGAYLAEVDPYRHLRTTSAWASCPRDWAHPAIDVAQEHFYLRPADRARVEDEVAAIVERAALLREHAARKPALLGEFGLATDDWRLSESMERDTDLIHFHNALWASALSGLSGTAMFWWWEELDQRDAYRHYRPIADYIADIPFTTAGLRPAGVTMSDGTVRAIGLQGKACFYGWLLSEAATWTRIEAGQGPTADTVGATITLRGLLPGGYRVEWWDTRGAGVLAEDDVLVEGAGCAVEVPAFRTDIACKIVPR